MRTVVELSLITDSGRVIPISALPCVIGRDAGCQLRIQSEHISRNHCVISRSDSALLIRDLGSTNGTFLNGKLIQGESVLLDGDAIKLGSVRLEISLSAAPAATPKKSGANDTWPSPTNSTGETRRHTNAPNLPKPPPGKTDPRDTKKP